MSFKYTTGEVIDKLKIGDEAINEDDYVIKYSDKGDLLYYDKGEEPTSEDKFNPTYHFVKKDRWKITPKFVSFDEAMEAYSDKGAIITYHQDDADELKYTFNHQYGEFKSINADVLAYLSLLMGDGR